MRGIIYKWTNKINNKCYIGKTIREKERIKQHLKNRSYNSYNECKESLKLPNIKGISKVIHGHNKTYYGYTFTKIEDNTINKSEE